MYNTFFRYFGLRENPFNVNPNPGYLYFNDRTRAVLEDMASAIQAGKGLIVLTGEAGTGKTTLINRLKQWLEKQRIPTAFIFNPHLEVNELFDLMLADYGITVDDHLKASSLGRLNQWLRDRHTTGKSAVLILDEAQGLPLPILEQVRLLLNHESSQQRLLQIVLSGQPELEDKLKRPEMRQVRQRISLRCQTTGLSQEETRAYIARRMQIAGGTGREVFAPEAIDTLHLYSRGIPRVLNVLCEHAMIRAYTRQAQPIPASMVAEAAKELQFDDVRPIVGRALSQVFSATLLPPEPVLSESLLEPPPVITETPLAPLSIPAIAVAVVPAPVVSEPVMPESAVSRVEAPVAESSAPKWTWFDATLDGSKLPRKNVPINNDSAVAPELAALLGLDDEKRSSISPIHGSSSAPHAPKPAHEPAGGFVQGPDHEEDPDLVVVSRSQPREPIAGHPLVRESRDYLIVAFNRVKPAVAQTWQKFVTYAKSQQWDRNLDALLRWLQQPLPPLKVHRRAGD